jgi:CheY-like chemotaxis protein
VPCKGCILVVDDDPDTREALAACFEEGGCTVALASDGRDALEQLARQGRCPCFILLDMNMPRIDGPALAGLLREDDRYRDVPVISMSAGDARLPDARAHSHLAKPFRFEVLAPTVERLCQDPGWLHAGR